MIRSLAIAAALMLLIAGNPARADDLMLDEGRQINGLWVFPSLSEPSRWRYLSQDAVVATNDAGAPIFSLTFFVSDDAEEETDALDPSSVTNAAGGAALHLIVEYRTDPELVQEVQDELRALTEDETATLVGPVIFDDGHYSVVTSVLDDAAQATPALLTHRPAPLVEGNRVAITARLSAREATMLLGTLRSSTPDFSVLFDMTFTGLSQAFDATMVIDWEKTLQSVSAGVGGSVYYISADVEAAIERAMQDGAITLEINGDDAQMEDLIARTHASASEMMFAPIEPEQQAAQGDDSLMGTIGALLQPDGLLGSRNTTGFGLGVTFKLKDIRSEGETRLSFNKRASVPRRTIMLVNLGSVALAEDAINFVTTVNPSTQLRKIFVGLDGQLQQELGGFVNSVEVSMRKAHPEGRETLQQIVLRPETQSDSTIHGPLTYSNIEQEQAEDWLRYDFKSAWSFQGGGAYQSEWQATDASMINLLVPFHRRAVLIEGDSSPLVAAGVRAVVIEVSAPFFNQTQIERRVYRPANAGDVVAVEPITLTLPRDDWHYDWSMTWLMDDRSLRRAQGRDDLGFLFLDEIPPAPPEEN